MDGVYVLYLDETRPQPRAGEAVFAVNAGIFGTRSDITALKSEIPYFQHEVKWSSKKDTRGYDLVSPIATLYSHVQQGRLKLVFSLAVRDDFHDDNPHPVDPLSKVLIAEHTIQDIGHFDTLHQFVFSVDGDRDKILRRADLERLWAFQRDSALNIKAVNIVSNTRPRSRMTFLTDHLAGGMHVLLERLYGTKDPLDSNSNRAEKWIPRRQAVVGAMTAGFRSVAGMEDFNHDFVNTYCVDPTRKDRTVKNWADIPPVQFIRVTPDYFPK